MSTTEFKNKIGDKQYQLSNHLGNVLTTISDVKVPVQSGGTITGYTAKILSATDYSSFGAPTPSNDRNWSNSGYRYGFNGMEKDDEMKGEGNSYDFGARMYDSRLGRFIKIDLNFKESPSWNPYRFGFNNPVRFSDENGTFEIDEATAAAYPALDTYLQNIAIEYAGKPDEFRAAFKEYSEMSDEQIARTLEYKKVANGTPVEPNQPNPRIIVENLNGANGETPVVLSGSVEGDKFNQTSASTTGIIKLNKSMVENYEKQANNQTSSVDYEAAKLLLESTIFHEDTHYGEVIADKKLDQTSIVVKNGQPSIVGNSSGKLQEGGKEFEKKAYGADVDSANANSLVRAGNIGNAVTNDAMRKIQENLTPAAVSTGTNNGSTGGGF